MNYPAGPGDGLIRAQSATVRVVLGDGAVWEWTMTGPLEGVHVISDRRDAGRLPDLEIGPDAAEIPRGFPVQLGFAFALPLGGPVPATLHIERAEPARPGVSSP